MKEYRNTNTEHTNLSEVLANNNSNSIFKQIPSGILPLEKSQSANVCCEDDFDDNICTEETGLIKSTSDKFSNKIDQNFKVIVRVRPPLPREIDSNDGFSSIVQISKNKYLGAEIKEGGRQRDIAANPHICAFHTFSFDYVYGEDSSQKFIYQNTAKAAVLSVLEGYSYSN